MSWDIWKDFWGKKPKEGWLVEGEQGGASDLVHPAHPETFAFASPQLGFFKSAKRRREPGPDPTPKALE